MDILEPTALKWENLPVIAVLLVGALLALAVIFTAAVTATTI